MKEELKRKNYIETGSIKLVPIIFKFIRKPFVKVIQDKSLDLLPKFSCNK